MALNASIGLDDVKIAIDGMGKEQMVEVLKHLGEQFEERLGIKDWFKLCVFSMQMSELEELQAVLEFRIREKFNIDLETEMGNAMETDGEESEYSDVSDEEGEADEVDDVESQSQPFKSQMVKSEQKVPYYKPPVTYNYVIVDKQVYDTQKEQAKDDENFFSVANRQNAFRAIIKCGVSGNPKGRFVEIKSRKECGESPLEMVIFDQHMNNDPVSQDVAAVAVEFAIYRLKPYFAARVYGGPGYAKAPAINAPIKSSVSGTDVKEAGKKVLKALSENSVVKSIKESSYICDICGAGYALKKTWEQHSRNHTPYFCALCGKDFKSEAILEQHNKIHEKPRHKCKLCPRTYTDQGNLSRHVRRDHKGIPFKCKHCDFEDKNNRTVERHMDKEHKGLRFECEWPSCERTFDTRDSMNMHYRKHLSTR